MASKDTVIIYGDPHLSSKSYGSHKDYPRESLEYFQKITQLAEDIGATYIIGTGDLTYGKFHTLEYRRSVEKELLRQNEITNGNVYSLKGNHDSATNGMTEYEFYVEKGLLKHADKLDVQTLHFTLADYGRLLQVKPNVNPDEINVLVSHDYLKFKDTQLPNFGTAIELDRLSQFFDIDYIICGHIHKTMAFKGLIIRGNEASETLVFYPGCMARPAYSNNLDLVGSVAVLTVEGDRVTYDKKEIPLWAIEDSFVMEEIEERQEKREEKASRVDISDVVKQLDARDNNFGNPEDRIMSMYGVDEKYKLKAIQLLQEES